jgi:SAM-dependent methyltransferase
MNVAYRLGLISDLGVLHGEWLDCGCAEGGYTVAMPDWGASLAVGVDIEADRIEEAQAANGDPRVRFVHGAGERLPFEDASFDGVFLNEVLEHVDDEAATLSEIERILRPGGHLVVMCPNRWFPFEGHGLQFGERKFLHPAPFVPWLPERITGSWLRARNYWPSQLRGLIADSGLEIVSSGSVFPVFEKYRWLPGPVIARYQAAIPRLSRSRALSLFGLSTMVLARKR